MATVVVAGASGLVGTAAVERFAAEGWDVVALSRRAPELAAGGPARGATAGPAPGSVRHVPVDLRDRAGVDEALGSVVGPAGPVSHLVYAAVYETPGVVAGWRDPDQMQVNRDMLRHVLDALSARGGLRHVNLLQGTKAYGAHLHRIPIPARERLPRDPHANFYWLQEDLVRERAAAEGWAFTVLRPQLIVGPAHGVALSMPPILGVYAALCRAEGKPFAFPGGSPGVNEAVDARIVAGALHWAATTPAAAGETYNITNGDVFDWRQLWPALADTLGVATGPDTPLSLGDHLPSRAGLWEQIVARCGLRPLSLAEVVGESHHFADACLAFGSARPLPPMFVSTVKIRQAGFTEFADTEDSFCDALRTLIERRILPGPHDPVR